MIKFPNSAESEITEICKKYPGLQSRDLCQMNPWYSCVICSKLGCKHIGNKNHLDRTPIGHACINHEKCTESEFALRYDFNH